MLRNDKELILMAVGRAATGGRMKADARWWNERDTDKARGFKARAGMNHKFF